MKTRAGYIALTAIALIYTVGYLFTVPILDTTRDLLEAHGIARGQSLPLVGPVFDPMGLGFHVGPAWFYLLAVPLALTGSLTVTSLYVGALAAVKFPLAYLCGRDLAGARFGFYFALLLALPGWATLEQLTFLHVNLVQTAALLVAWACVRLHVSGDHRWLIALGLFFALALHAHPANLAIGPLVLWVIALHVTRRGAPGALLAVLALLALLAPWIPLLVHHWQGGWSGWVQLEAGPTLAERWRLLANVPALLAGVWWNGPELVSRYVLGGGALLHGLWMAGVGALLGAGLVGLVVALRRGARRGLGVVLVVNLALTAAALAVLRDTTPYHMALVLVPAGAAVLAFGLARLAAHPRGRAGAVDILVAGVVAIQFPAVSAKVAYDHWYEGVGALPRHAVSDVKQPAGEPLDPAVRVPVVAAAAVGRWLCARQSEGTVAVHGTLAAHVDTFHGLGARLHCGSVDGVRLLGQSAADSHYSGLPAAIWRALESAPEAWIGPLGVARVERVIHPEAAHPVPDGSRYPPYPFARGAGETVVRSITGRADEALVVATPHYAYSALHELEVRCNGKPVPPVAEAGQARAYRCRPGPNGGPPSWRVTARSNGPDWLDVHLVKAPDNS